MKLKGFFTCQAQGPPAGPNPTTDGHFVCGLRRRHRGPTHMALDTNDGNRIVAEWPTEEESIR